jgi:protein SCO1
MSRRAAAAALLGVALACTAGGCSRAGDTAAAPTTQPTGQGSPKLTGAAVLPGSPALDFSLRDAYGRAVRLSAQRGRVVLLTFLYTQCRDVCPIIAEHLNTVLRELGPARREVTVIAVSVDPARDTPAAVRAYIRLHGLLPEFHFASRPVPTLRRVWQNYNVLAMARNQEVVDHSAPTLVIDRLGRPRVYYLPGFRTSDVLHDVRLLLARPAPGS